MAKQKFSEKYSMLGWNAWKCVKGRKRSAITCVTAVLGYLVMDQHLVGLIAGPVFEAVWAVISFYASKVELK